MKRKKLKVFQKPGANAAMRLNYELYPAQNPTSTFPWLAGDNRRSRTNGRGPVSNIKKMLNKDLG